MVSGLAVPPTKSALLQLQRQVGFLRQGHDLLERKQELLIRLINKHLQRYRQLRRQTEEILQQAQHSLALTYLRTGQSVLHHAVVGRGAAIDVRLRARSEAGVRYPVAQIWRRALQPISLFGTEPSLDDTREHMARLVETLAALGESETALKRLLHEHRRIQTRVNALKHNIIPQYQRRIREIKGALEEDERQTLFQIKVLRDQGKIAG